MVQFNLYYKDTIIATYDNKEEVEHRFIYETLNGMKHLRATREEYVLNFRETLMGKDYTVTEVTHD